MIPLKTVQGLSQQNMKILIGNRKVYIWGNSLVGCDVLTSLTKSGIQVSGFIDTRANQIGQLAYDFNIFNVYEILIQKNIFIIISTVNFRQSAEKICSEHNLIKDTDYIKYIDVSRPVAAIDIAGFCNLACPSCPRGNMPNLTTGIMGLSTYKQVYNKLISEVPNLTTIELFTWGEPLLNPDIDKIVYFTEQTTPCIISTNLQNITHLESLIKANPSHLRVTINGFEKDYEKHMQGACWKTLLENLNLLKTYIDRYNCTTRIELQIFLRTKDTIPCTFYKSLALHLGFEYIFCDLYTNGYEHYLSFCQSKKLPDTILENFRSTGWLTNKAIQLAKRDITLPCLPQRIFPIINWDKSVALCHVYYGPNVADNFLEISWDKLLKKRHSMVHCKECQKYSLHRLDIEVLRQKYPVDFQRCLCDVQEDF